MVAGSGTGAVPGPTLTVQWTVLVKERGHRGGRVPELDITEKDYPL